MGIYYFGEEAKKRSREGMGDDFLSVDELVVTRFIKKKSLRVKS